MAAVRNYQRIRRRLSAMLLVIVVTAAGCAQPGEPGLNARPAEPSSPKRITAAISGDPATLYNKLSSSVRGVDAVEKLVNVGLVVADHTDTLRPRLAEAVPSIENELWQVLPDGRMQTTLRIRDGARWHDGNPVTAEDLTFTWRVVSDPDLPAFSHLAYSAVESVAAQDARTVLIRWNRPYVDADQMFGPIAMPLPKHLLETPYLDNKAAFTDLPYWSQEFVGNGPFRLKDWSIGSHLVFEAFEGYALGKPAIDTITVRVILDTNTLVSNVLAGAVDVTLGRNFSPEQGVLVREQWRNGRVDVGRLMSALNVIPQFLNPSPSVIGDVRFRRALYQALDRQTMAETLEGGLVSAADSWLMTTLPEYPELSHYVVRYEFDPRSAVQQIEGLGYTRGADGVFQDAAGQRLAVELRAITAPEIIPQTTLIVADGWQRAGVAVEQTSVPAQRTPDQAYRATFPGFEVLRIPSDVFSGPAGLHSSAARTPENGFRGVGGNNYARYSHLETDELVERFLTTVRRRDRLEITGQIVRHMTDQVVYMPLFFDPPLGFVSNRMVNVPPLGQDPPWNAEQWDVR